MGWRIAGVPRRLKVGEFARPKIVVSRCLGFAHCRYDGAIVPSAEVDALRPFVDFTPVCPEMEIGLGVPRDPIRIVAGDAGERLVQPSTSRDVTSDMKSFAASFLDSLASPDGFILKYRSPSCGIKEVKIYGSAASKVPVRRGRGLFGGAVLSRFGDLPVEDEGRLLNFRIREHFLIRAFTLASFRRVRSSGSIKHLVQFQAENKLLLMAYSQKEMRIMGRLVANLEKRPAGDVIEDYYGHLKAALLTPPRYTSAINVLMHALGYFSEGLTPKEKAFFLKTLEEYRKAKVPLSVPAGIARSYVVRFETDYLMQQTFFRPYPEELVEITDSGKGRDL